ncbi:MAG: MFS transporter, partial [Alistipes sp.]|nr:MFS transporter [Alistipes sp.]
MEQTESKKSPLWWVPSAYFAMGLPLILINLVAPIMFNDFEISDAQVAFWTSLLILPWSLKPIWSPLMEMYRTKKFFVVTTQLVSGLSLAMISMALSLPDFFPYVIAAMTILAFSGATHDIALDGVYIAELTKTQQAQFVGWQGAFYNLAKVTAMGGLVFLAGVLEEKFGVLYAWVIIMLLSGVLLMVLGLYHWRVLPTGGQEVASKGSFKETMRDTWHVIAQFFQKKYIWIYIAWIV